jgi:hypothetical protein
MSERTRVWIVDDSRIFRSVLEQELKVEGAEVVALVWSGAKPSTSSRPHRPIW